MPCRPALGFLSFLYLNCHRSPSSQHALGLAGFHPGPCTRTHTRARTHTLSLAGLSRSSSAAQTNPNVLPDHRRILALQTCNRCIVVVDNPQNAARTGAHMHAHAHTHTSVHTLGPEPRLSPPSTCVARVHVSNVWMRIRQRNACRLQIRASSEP